MLERREKGIFYSLRVYVCVCVFTGVKKRAGHLLRIEFQTPRRDKYENVAYFSNYERFNFVDKNVANIFAISVN